MSSVQPNHTTVLLRRMSEGDAGAREQLLPLVYDELHRIANRLMARQSTPQTLQATDVIHEAYLKLAHADGKQWEGRNHFLRVAATAMRSVMIDYARARRTGKRGGDRSPVTLHAELARQDDSLAQVLAVHDGLEALAGVDRQLVELVELRFFGGFDNREIAGILGVSLRTVERSWQFARAWLRSHFEGEAV